jgi:hypothetical protein
LRFRLLAAVVLTSVIAGTVTAPVGASSTPSPYALMRTVVANAESELTMRLTTTATLSGMKIVQVTDASRNEGRQSVTLSSGGKSNTVIAELIAGQLYVKGDAAILTSYLALSQANANELAGQWFGIPKSSGYYTQVAEGLTISTALAEVTMTSSVTRSPEATIHGVRVDVLKGTSVKSSLEPAFKETLYSSTTKKALPVEVTQSVEGSLGTIVFSHWGEKISLVAPRVKLHLN